MRIHNRQKNNVSSVEVNDTKTWGKHKGQLLIQMFAILIISWPSWYSSI
jgi:hypothetical protein